ncbi:hypothetical protein [Mucilaginibacter glaciei]|uniref:Lipoprotein n=1 Tax=Mucilaginibacter glaciei TaxID=2772109 RepID=A0A926NLR9_9SPHI|nr:hypothetical protein [Mucilaginibacter glaciei]MBD1394439.1 hypothetical protein [Mucilaginibacter glaciei]
MFTDKLIFVGIIAALALASCSRPQNIYTSECSEGVIYKKITFSHLVDSLKYYDKQYVEVTGKYVEGKQLSALVNDSTFAEHSNRRSVWVNFSQDCALVLPGTNTGLFQFGDGNFSKINNRLLTIRGRVDKHQKGPGKDYRGAIDMVSYVRIY